MDFVLLGKNPVSAEQKVGSDTKYDPEFIDLQTEIDKLSSPSSLEGADWKKVSQLSSVILAEKSKDILVAGYFAVSRIYLDQIVGLKVGLTVYHDLIITFWEDLFPPIKRMKGRINAVEWWIEKTEKALMHIKPAPFSQEMKEGILTDLNAIEKLLNSYLPAPISVRPIERAFNNFKVLAAAKPAPAVSSQPENRSDLSKSETQAQEAPRATTPHPSIGEIASFSDAEKVMESGFRAIEQAARFHLNSGLESPLGYRYMRLAIWGGIEALPVTTDGQKTIIPAPDAQFWDTVKGLMIQGDLKSLLEVAEGRASEYIFWLDLHYWIAKALTGLGVRYEKAKAAVIQEIAFLIHRFPELPGLQFADGTPFADAETQAWIKTIGLGGVSGGMGGGSFTVSRKDATDKNEGMIGEEYLKALDLVKNNKLHEAVDLLQGHLRKSDSKRETLLWRIALSRVLLTASRIEIATPHLEQILCDTENYKLEAWEPELALDGLKAVQLGYKIHPDPDIQKKSEDVLKRIVMLDATAAF